MEILQNAIFFFKLYLNLIFYAFFIFNRAFSKFVIHYFDKLSVDHFSQQDLSKKCWSCSRGSWLMSANLLHIIRCLFIKSITLFVCLHYCFRVLFLTISCDNMFAAKCLLFHKCFYSTVNQGSISCWCYLTTDFKNITV